MKETVNIISLGCSKNLVDTELLMGHLQVHFEVVCDAPEYNQDILIVNTCGFIADAKEESINTILDCIDSRVNGNTKKLFVMGCMTERYKGEMEKELPEVDAFFGKFQFKDILAALGKTYQQDFLQKRVLTTPNHYAYLKISEGCDRKCSFCAIPAMTGSHTSISIDELVAQTEFLANQGVKELLVIAQDLSSYGLDLYKEQKLAELIERLTAVEGIEWIKLHYAYPYAFPTNILGVMRQNPKVCNYLDIALQHSSDKMLKKMRRLVTRQSTVELISKIRKEVPDIELRTTLMVGHPGETEEDFEDLKQFVQEMKFERLGCFAYSHEDNTYAEKKYKDDVPFKVKMQRLNEIMELQQNISAELTAKKIGKTIPVLIDRVEGEYFVGRSSSDSPEVDPEVFVTSQTPLEVGNFYQVAITDANEFDLFGKLD